MCVVYRLDREKLKRLYNEKQHGFAPDIGKYLNYIH